MVEAAEPMTRLTAGRGSAAFTAPFLATGNPRPVAAELMKSSPKSVLVVVVETQGSTYSCPGTLGYLCAGGWQGWISGGCLEAEVAAYAARVAEREYAGQLEVDSRADEDLVSGSAAGCRGLLRMVFIPLDALGNHQEVLRAWWHDGTPLVLTGHPEGFVRVASGNHVADARMDPEENGWSADRQWSVTLARLPRIAVYGGGPEATGLLALMRDLGWRTALVERRERWRLAHSEADFSFASLNPEAITKEFDACVVMHHNFEMDREALAILAATDVPFIGLLGPRSRREDLFRLLTPEQVDSLRGRLRSPVGLPLGGRGPEAIALSIAAELQAWRALVAQS